MPATNLSKILAAINHPKLRTITDEKGARNRLYHLGLHEVCGRCWGSGSYGPRQVDGGRCFGCRGTGKLAPKLTRKMVKRVQEEITAERLEAYAEELRRKAEERRMAKGASDRVRQADRDSFWRNHYYPESNPRGIGYNSLGYAINDMMKKLEREFNSATVPGYSEPAPRVLELETAMLEALRRRDAGLRYAMEGGELDLARERADAIKARKATENTYQLERDEDALVRARAREIWELVAE